MKFTDKLSSTAVITTLWGVCLSTSVASIGYFVSAGAKPIVGKYFLTIAATTFALSAAGVFLKTRGVFKEIRTKIDNIYDALEFVSGLKHCGKFCGIRTQGWQFGDEYSLIKGRENILHLLVDIIIRAEDGADVMLISSGFNLGDEAWKIVLKKAEKINLRVVVNEDKVNPGAESYVKLLSGVSDLRSNENTNGIRTLVVRGKEGYICNSKSESQKGNPGDYWAIYSSSSPTVKMMENIFENMWEAPGNKPIMYRLKTLQPEVISPHC